jgi:formylmethanofuran dehydrogenase subunit B
MSYHPPESRRDVPCGFCGLLCDDLSVTIDHGHIRVDAGSCPRAAAGFAAGNRALEAGATPRVKGQPTGLEQAIAAAAGVLRGAQAPLFGGCGTHLPGIRGILELADATGGTLDHMNSYSMFRNLHVLQNSGWVVTSLSEVRNRADLLVCFGTDIGSRLPRFYERCLWVDDTLFGLRAEEREVVMLGAPKDAALATSPSRRPPQVLSCANEDLAEVAQALRELVRGAPVRSDAVAGIPVAALARLAQRLKAARYGVVAWVSSDLDFDHAELAVQAACDLVRELNAHTRCNGLPLGGSDGDYTAHQVCTWQTGFTLRTRLSAAGPQHDPRNFDAERLLARGATDALVWVSSFDPAKTPPPGSVPTVVLGHPAMEVDCEVFIPVGVPGIDAAGHLFRTDSSVAVPMPQLRDRGLPDVANVTAAILAALKPQHAGEKREARAC